MNTPDNSEFRLLIADDTPENLRLLERMLRQRGYQVSAQSNGESTLKAALHNPPDLILLDIDMPDLNGFEVCARLKENPDLRDIPVLFLSALSEVTDKVHAFRTGGVDYVTKPFQIEELESRVKTHLKIRSLQRQLQAHNDNLERLVTERTRDLDQAYERLRCLDQVKGDFLRMISHEMHTPAHGVLGVSQLILDLCPPSPERDELLALFDGARARLEHLLHDAMLLNNIEFSRDNLTLSPTPFLPVLQKAIEAVPDIRVSTSSTEDLGMVEVFGDADLLRQALTSLLRLAAAFSPGQNSALLSLSTEEQQVRLNLPLPKLTLSEEDAARFFDLVSDVRSSSPAESLGLAPVVLQRILSLFCGQVRLVKLDGPRDLLQATLQQHADMLPLPPNV